MVPVARSLLLITLAALLIVLAGPSAAVYALPSDPGPPSVAGVAPNGDDAAPRSSHPDLPVSSALPGERITLWTPARARATLSTAGAVVSSGPARSQQDRAPPATG